MSPNLKPDDEKALVGYTIFVGALIVLLKLAILGLIFFVLFGWMFFDEFPF